jgi:heat shock protein 5
MTYLFRAWHGDILPVGLYSSTHHKHTYHLNTIEQIYLTLTLSVLLLSTHPYIGHQPPSRTMARSRTRNHSARGRGTWSLLLYLSLILCAGLFFAQARADSPDSPYSDTTDISGPVIGIDLGTTFSCVGIMKDGRVDIITNDQGNRITPSWVAFSDSERLIGDAAKNQFAANPHGTIYDVKRLIGRKISDSDVQKDMKTFPFKVVDAGGSPKVRVEVEGVQKDFSPEEVSGESIDRNRYSLN